MKEVEKIEKDKVEIVGQKEVEKKTVIKGRVRVIPGLKLFKMDSSTGIIEEVKVEDGRVADYHDPSKPSKKRAEYDEKALYIQALNMKNAKRKFEKFVNKLFPNKNSYL